MNSPSASSLLAILIVAWPVEGLVEAGEDMEGWLDVTW